MARIPSHPRIAAAQLSTRWLAELSVADSVAEVVSVTRAYLETWSASETLRLPYHCRPGRINEPKQIHELAFLLERAQDHFTGQLVDAMVLDRMTSFFKEAAGRLDGIAEEQGQPPFLEGIQRLAA